MTVFVDCLLSVFRVTPGGLYTVGSLRQRVAGRSQYCSGIALLDELAGGDFTAVPPLRQQLILAQRQLAAFAGLLFGHIIEALGHTDSDGADSDLDHRRHDHRLAAVGLHPPTCRRCDAPPVRSGPDR